MFRTALGVAAATILVMATGWTQQAPATGPYKILRAAKVGGDGGFDYVNVDVEGRRLYLARRSTPPQISVYDLDTLEKVGEVPMTGAHGAVIDHKSGLGFATSTPVTMFDIRTLLPIRKIDTKGNPDGAFFDPFNETAYILSHPSPNVTAINGRDGSILKSFDLGGAPQQAASDGAGHVYIDVAELNGIEVVDAKTLTVTGHYDLAAKARGCGGLGMDAKNHILFAACHNPASMVMLNSDTGRILDTVPISPDNDGMVFNPNTLEAFSSGDGGTLSIVKEVSPTSFVLEQDLPTMPGAKTCALDTKTNHVILISAEFGAAPNAGNGNAGNGNAGKDGEKGGRGRGGAAKGQVLPGTFTILMVGK